MGLCLRKDRKMSNRLVEAINAVYDRFVDGAGAPTIPEPVQSDLEAIMWNLAGADVDLPVADTGLEGALANLAEHADEIGGSSDYSTCSVSISGIPDTASIDFVFCGSYESEGQTVYVLSTGTISDGTYEAVMYKGSGWLHINGIADPSEVTASGNITYDAENEQFIYTGDCTITFGGK